jgi:hypothetical protein
MVFWAVKTCELIDETKFSEEQIASIFRAEDKGSLLIRKTVKLDFLLSISALNFKFRDTSR